ncbi:MAG: hypothetical protein K0S27_439 [Gammaproteobacteria bacterium]|nr:hypothetical protein [Gammaproteobacteria bacterium]
MLPNTANSEGDKKLKSPENKNSTPLVLRADEEKKEEPPDDLVVCIVRCDFQGVQRIAQSIDENTGAPRIDFNNLCKGKLTALSLLIGVAENINNKKDFIELAHYLINLKKSNGDPVIDFNAHSKEHNNLLSYFFWTSKDSKAFLPSDIDDELLNSYKQQFLPPNSEITDKAALIDNISMRIKFKLIDNILDVRDSEGEPAFKVDVVGQFLLKDIIYSAAFAPIPSSQKPEEAAVFHIQLIRRLLDVHNANGDFLLDVNEISPSNNHTILDQVLLYFSRGPQDLPKNPEILKVIEKFLIEPQFGV